MAHDFGETVRVRLDDALVGALPPVCAMTGACADGYAPLIVPKRLGVAWALLLAGPVGVAVLVALYPRLRTRYVARVPMSAAAFGRLYQLWVRRLWCAWFGLAGVVAAIAIRWVGGVAIVLGAAGVVSLGAAVSAHWRVPWAQPTMVADASGRCVTLRGVHERFKAAVDERARR
jgi:hypothetical protein